MKKDYFNEGLIQAVLLHVVLVLLFSILGSVKKMFTSPVEINIIQSSVRVDVIGMPKFTIQELKEMKIAPKGEIEIKAEEPAPAEEIKEEPSDSNEAAAEEVIDESREVPNKKLDLSNLLNKMSEKKLPKVKKVKKSKKTGNVDKKKIRSLILEGNQISEGSSLVGDQSSDKAGKFTLYASNLKNLIQPHWTLPSYLQGKDLQCRLVVYINESGKAFKVEVWESSGDEEYDRRAMVAVKSASPFPAPDKEIKDRLATGEVTLGFPL